MTEEFTANFGSPSGFVNSIEKNGLSIKHNFISHDVLSGLNSELDIKLKYPTIGYGGTGFLGLSRNLRSLPPTEVFNTLNFFELAIDVFKETVPHEKQSSYILTYMQFFSEKNNPKALYWHTDHMKGTYRAQIYLSGAGKNSGGFRYMHSAHKEHMHNVEYKLGAREIEQCKEWIIECSGSAGDLICFEPYGFHAKHPCTEERRTIMFEFQPKDSPYQKTEIIIPNTELSKKVLENISLFLPGKSGYPIRKDGASYFDSLPVSRETLQRIIVVSLLGQIKLLWHRMALILTKFKRAP